MLDQTKENREQRRPGALGVHSLDHFSLMVPDLAEAVAFYTSFGLDLRAEGDAFGVYTFGHPHRWGVLQEGKRKRFGYLSFGIFEDDLPAFRKRFEQMNVERIAPPPGNESNGIWFYDEEGNVVELAVKPKSSPTEKSGFHDVSSPPGVAGAPLRSRAPIIRLRRLSHIALFTADVSRKVEFYSRVLGLRLSDRSGDFAAFLHGPHGSEHHMLAVAKSGGPGFHHCSWDVGSINDIGLGTTQMLAKGYDRLWGVGRHVMGSNYFCYVADPWGSYSEYSADMDYIPEDFDWQPHDHAPEDAFTLWGPAPPPEFIINHEIA